MPAYKTDYLREAIQSILNQTYNEFRLIISDDCSPYDVEKIVKEFDDSRIIFRRNKTNIGGVNLVEHWNLLLGLANTEFIILSPDDDVYSSRFLEEINTLTHKYPQCNVFKSRAQDINEFGEPYKTDKVYPEFITQTENIKFQSCDNIISGIGQYVFRSKPLLRIGGFVNYPVAWWSDVMTHVILSDNGMAITNDILFSFRHFNGNISSRKSSPTERISKTKSTLMFCDDMKSIIQTNTHLSTQDYTNICQFLNNTKLKWIYSSASVSSLKDNIKLIQSNPDAFNSLSKKIRLLRYWLTRDIQKIAN